MVRLDCHKVHTVTLLMNAKVRNKWINDPLLHVRALPSILAFLLYLAESCDLAPTPRRALCPLPLWHFKMPSR